MDASQCLRAAATVLVILSGITAPAAGADPLTPDPYIDQLAERADAPALNWVDCQGGFVCATAEVPLDYNRPQGEQLHLAVIKLPTTEPDRRIGTLFVNFGGPGQSGVDRLRARASWPWLFSAELRERFDLVSWDQRGVARSGGVHCFSDAGEQWQFLSEIPALPSDAASEAALMAWSAEFAARCSKRAGPVLEHASSANSSRDLDLLRRAVGDTALTYHGISYGTQLGATYANLFPGRVRALVLDGSIDFEGNIGGHGSEGRTIPLNTRQDVAAGTASAFEQFLRDCAAAGSHCAFSQGDPWANWAVLVERSRASRVTVWGHQWTYPELVVTTLAEPDSYPQLAVLLQQLFETGTATPDLLADITGSGPPPVAGADPYLNNREEAYNAIQCSDSVVPTDPAMYSQAALRADESAPVFGRISVFDTVPCAFWGHHDPDRYEGPWNRRTSAPILVLNTRNDPATPLAGAYAGASQLNEAGVVVTEGAGHTSMYVASACTERVKREYLFSGSMPPAGTTCSRDRSPFDQVPKP